MSFSSEIKEELSKLNNLKDKQAVYYELVGYLITKNTKVEKKIKFSTENEFNINRFNKLLNNMDIKYKIEMQGNFYVITFAHTKRYMYIYTYIFHLIFPLLFLLICLIYNLLQIFLLVFLAYYLILLNLHLDFLT